MAKKKNNGKKSAFTTRIDSKILFEARAAVNAVPGLTFCELVETALRKSVSELRRKHNEGKPFRARRTRLTPGRRPGT